MTELTEKETRFAVDLRDNDIISDTYGGVENGTPEQLAAAVTWVECVTDDFGPSAGGIVASLVKKGIVTTNGETIGFTAAGAKIAHELGRAAVEAEATCLMCEEAPATGIKNVENDAHGDDLCADCRSQMDAEEEAAEHPKSVRFWTFENGSPIRLTLRDNDPVRWSSGGPTEEGWSRTSLEWTYVAEERAVFVESLDEGRDCDGYTSRTYRGQCDISGLDVGPERDGIRYPEWHRLDVECRDEYAERAGY